MKTITEINPLLFNQKRSINVEVSKEMPALRRQSLIRWVGTLDFRLEKIANKYKLDGISAGQIGIYRRVIYCRVNQSCLMMVNPTIIHKYDSGIYCLEQCVCFRNDRYHIKRPSRIKLAYYDNRLRYCVRDFDEQPTRLIMHLLDHLDYKPIEKAGLNNMQMRELGLEPYLIDTDWLPPYCA
jgi:peptide deformylase